MNSVYFYILFYIVFSTSFAIISRKTLSKTKYEYAYTILWQLFSGLLATLFIPFSTLEFHLSSSLVVIFCLAIICWALMYMFLFSAYKFEEASVLSPIAPFYNVVAFGVTVIFFGAKLNLPIALGFMFITAACLLSGLYKTKFRPSQGVACALLTVLFEGLAFGFSSAVTRTFSIPLFLAISFLLPGLIDFFVLLRPKISQLKYELETQWHLILLNAVVVDLVYLSLYTALRHGRQGQVISFGAISTFLIALIGIVFLGERKNAAVKVAAALLAMVGVILAQLS